MGPWDHVYGYQLADPFSGSGAGVSRRLDGANIATDHDSHKSAPNLLFSQQPNIGRLDHGVSSLYGANQTTCLYHSECV